MIGDFQLYIRSSSSSVFEFHFQPRPVTEIQEMRASKHLKLWYCASTGLDG